MWSEIKIFDKIDLGTIGNKIQEHWCKIQHLGEVKAYGLPAFLITVWIPTVINLYPEVQLLSPSDYMLLIHLAP